jgi:bacteriocin-like protein
MNKDNDPSKLSHAKDHGKLADYRITTELTIDELNAVSGGQFQAHLIISGTKQGANKGGDPGAAIDAWNTLLKNYGYA